MDFVRFSYCEIMSIIALMYFYSSTILEARKVPCGAGGSGEDDGPGEQCLEDKAVRMAEEEIYEENGRRFCS
jgi:hypothetical protein